MSEEATTTKFIGDIVFNDGEQDVKASELGTKQWVNDNFPTYTYANKNYVQTLNIDTLDDMFNSMDPAPDSTDALTMKDDFVFDDSHVMSSKAVKMLIDKSKQNDDSETNTNTKDYIDITDYVALNAGEREIHVNKDDDTKYVKDIDILFSNYFGPMNDIKIEFLNSNEVKDTLELVVDTEMFEYFDMCQDLSANSFVKYIIFNGKKYELNDNTNSSYDYEGWGFTSTLKLTNLPMIFKLDYEPSFKVYLAQDIVDNPNTTITHYAPIEESMNAINDFIVGSPVYLTGKVYKFKNNEFISSTATDTTDCICSVKTNGKWNEYVGICVRIDDKNKRVTFATHGDYLVRVNDTSCYGIGDEVFVDEGELKVITGQTAITSKIRRTTVGIITAKINDNTLAVFKS